MSRHQLIEPEVHARPGSTLELRKVTKRFHQTPVVQELDLALHPGEFVSLLGPSGCGKTTTLRMIAGFEAADSGSILLDGQELTGLPANKREVNTVFQSYALFPHLSVAANIAYGLRQRRTPKPEIVQRVTEILQLVRLTQLADRTPAQLSGGQQQRVALARALVNRPRVLLLDEPLAALDRQLREEVQIELRLLQSRVHTTFLFVTHDQGETLAMSDRVAIMYQGRIAQFADPETIYQRPANLFVAGFVGQHNFFRQLRPLGTHEFVSAAGSRFRAARPSNANAEVTAAAPHRTVTAAVRPEALTLTAPENPGVGAVDVAVAPNSCAATVESVNPLGEIRQYVLRADSGDTLLARIPRTVETRHFSAGDRVRASWKPEHLSVFAETG